MDRQFWIDKWNRNEIGFHKSEAHPLLVAHLDSLGLQKGARIFIPLCGKTRDIPWLLEQGFRIAGAELSERAVEDLFQSLGLDPVKASSGSLTHYSAEGIDIYVGDIFDLTRDVLGAIDGVYDRAAIVALPPDMRENYAAHIVELTINASQLLISFDYDQSEMKGPPFSVPHDEIHSHYSSTYTVSRLANVSVEGGLKGQCPAMEEVWLLRAE